jgi:hypothetical protein
VGLDAADGVDGGGRYRLFQGHYDQGIEQLSAGQGTCARRPDSTQRRIDPGKRRCSQDSRLMPNSRCTHLERGLSRASLIPRCRQVVGNFRRRLSEMAYTALQLLRFFGRLLAGERSLNVPTTIQPCDDCVGPDLQPTCPITDAGRNTIPGDDPCPGMIDTSLVSGSPETVWLAPGLSRVASDEHQTFGTKPHIGQEPIKCSPFRHTFAGLYPQITPSPLGAQPSSS